MSEAIGLQREEGLLSFNKNNAEYVSKMLFNSYPRFGRPNNVLEFVKAGFTNYDGTAGETYDLLFGDLYMTVGSNGGHEMKVFVLDENLQEVELNYSNGTLQVDESYPFHYRGLIYRIEVTEGLGTQAWSFSGWKANVNKFEPGGAAGAVITFLHDGDPFDGSFELATNTPVYSSDADNVTLKRGGTSAQVSFKLPYFGGVEYDDDWDITSTGMGVEIVSAVVDDDEWFITANLTGVVDGAQLDCDALAQIVLVQANADLAQITNITFDGNVLESINGSAFPVNAHETKTFRIPIGSSETMVVTVAGTCATVDVDDGVAPQSQPFTVAGPYNFPAVDPIGVSVVNVSTND